MVQYRVGLYLNEEEHQNLLKLIKYFGLENLSMPKATQEIINKTCNLIDNKQKTEEIKLNNLSKQIDLLTILVSNQAQDTQINRLRSEDELPIVDEAKHLIDRNIKMNLNKTNRYSLD